MPSVNERSNLMRLLTLYATSKYRYLHLRSELVKWVKNHPLIFEDAFERWQIKQERLKLFENLPEYSIVYFHKRYSDIIKDTPYELIC